MTRTRLFQQVHAARCQSSSVPKGWLTLPELARAEGLGPTAHRGSFKYTVQEAVEFGILERKVFKVPTLTGMRKVYHYRRTAKAGR
jgi:hypothetical protein